MWLNYSKIKDDINLQNTANTALAKSLGIPNSTLKDRLSKNNLTPDDVFRIAIYFGREIGYYFDRPELTKAEEQEITYKTCKDCIEKQKKLDQAHDMLLKKDDELIDCQRNYISLMNEYSSYKGNRNCG